LTSRGGIKLRTTLDEPTPRARVASTFPITRSTRRSESKSSKRATPCWLLRAPPARAITASQTQGRVPLRRGEKLIRQRGLPCPRLPALLLALHASPMGPRLGMECAYRAD